MIRILGVEKSYIMFIAVFYIMNFLVGMGEIFLFSIFIKYRRLMLKILFFYDKIFFVYVL